MIDPVSPTTSATAAKAAAAEAELKVKLEEAETELEQAKQQIEAQKLSEEAAAAKAAGEAPNVAGEVAAKAAVQRVGNVQPSPPLSGPTAQQLTGEPAAGILQAARIARKHGMNAAAASLDPARTCSYAAIASRPVNWGERGSVSLHCNEQATFSSSGVGIKQGNKTSGGLCVFTDAEESLQLPAAVELTAQHQKATDEEAQQAALEVEFQTAFEEATQQQVAAEQAAQQQATRQQVRQKRLSRIREWALSPASSRTALAALEVDKQIAAKKKQQSAAQPKAHGVSLEQGPNSDYSSSSSEQSWQSSKTAINKNTSSCYSGSNEDSWGSVDGRVVDNDAIAWVHV